MILRVGYLRIILGPMLSFQEPRIPERCGKYNVSRTLWSMVLANLNKKNQRKEKENKRKEKGEENLMSRGHSNAPICKLNRGWNVSVRTPAASTAYDSPR